MRELEGTYACEFKREWEEEVEQSYRFQVRLTDNWRVGSFGLSRGSVLNHLSRNWPLW